MYMLCDMADNKYRIVILIEAVLHVAVPPKHSIFIDFYFEKPKFVHRQVNASIVSQCVHSCVSLLTSLSLNRVSTNPKRSFAYLPKTGHGRTAAGRRWRV